MNERIVDGWLTSAGERGYEAAFAQLLASEGHRVLHAPVHHSHEHGKDILSRAPDGSIHAFQLKAGNIGLGDLEEITPQLLALAGTAVAYPGIEGQRRPDRAFLVTNGRMSAPARNRLHSFNEANSAYGFPQVEAVERDQLVTRFVAAHGKYWPSDAVHLNKLLQIILGDSSGTFPVVVHAELLTAILSHANPEPTPIQLERALASCTLLTAYALGPWESAGNHYAEAEGWLTAAIFVMHAAERYDLPEDRWLLSYTLARDSARSALSLLMAEVGGLEDLVIPDLVEGLFYGTRAAQVCGMCAAFFIAERGSLEGIKINADDLRRVLIRERRYMKATGEAGIPALLLVASALQMLGHPGEAGAIVFSWATELVAANQPGSEQAIADPYHSVEEFLLTQFGAVTALDEEVFAGEAYTVHIALEWLARRGSRELVGELWPSATRMHLCEFAPSSAAHLLAHRDNAGELRTWALPQPGSWAVFSNDSQRLAESAIPTRLWRDSYCLPFLPLLYPQRLTSALAKALDYIVFDSVTIQFESDDEAQA